MFSFGLRLSEGRRIEADFRGSEGYPRLEFGVADLLKFGVVDLLKFGVVDLLKSCVVDLETGVGVVALEFEVVGLLERDPVRKSGNCCGEIIRFSGTTRSFLDMFP